MLSVDSVFSYQFKSRFLSWQISSRVVSIFSCVFLIVLLDIRPLVNRVSAILTHSASHADTSSQYAITINRSITVEAAASFVKGRYDSLCSIE